MEKFSLYDLLSTILPGAVFLFLLNFAREICDIYTSFVLTDKWELIVLISIIFGAGLYVLSFYLIEKVAFYKRYTGIYKPVCDLYISMSDFHSIMNEVLNKRAREWYGKDIFNTSDEYKRLAGDKQIYFCNLQDEFYDRIYYEVEYEGKLNTPIAFQSFYFFFRNIMLASLISLFVACGLLIYFLIDNQISTIMCSLTTYIVGVIILYITSNSIARWYRRRMVMKMYWAFYTYLNLKKE